MTRCIHNEADLNYSNSSQNTAIHKFPRWTDRRNKKNKKKHSLIQKKLDYSNSSHSYSQISTIDRKKNWKTTKW